jgi:hypothetical protein
MAKPGTLPLVIVHAYGAVPPVAAKVVLYKVSIVPLGRGDVVVMLKVAAAKLLVNKKLPRRASKKPSLPDAPCFRIETLACVIQFPFSVVQDLCFGDPTTFTTTVPFGEKTTETVSLELRNRI